MTRRVVILILIWLIPAAAQALAVLSAVPAPPAAAILRWVNGQTLSGELLEASAADVAWKTPLFEDPLLLRWQALRRIDQAMPSVPVTDPFSFAMRDGSQIYGDLIAITGESISIRSARHGEAVLKRPQVLSARRIRGAGLIFAGPLGDVGWDLLANRKKTSEPKRVSAPPPSMALPVKGGPGGALLMPYWNQSAFLDLALPDRADIEFRVRSKTRPDFALWLEAGAKQRVRVETWDDELVLVVADQFKAIKKLADDERDVALRVCWDRKTRSCSVFMPAGELVTEWEVPEDPGSADSGLFLHNKGRDLSLEFLRVRAWNENPPAKIDLRQPRVELADGRVVEGEVTSASPDSVQLRTPAKNGELSFPLGDVDAVVFSADRPQVSEQEATLSYADGTILMGRVASIKEGHVALGTAFSEGALTSRLDALRQLLINFPAQEGAAAEPPLSELDKIVVHETTLHGRLAAAGDDQLRWMPVGGLRAAIPAKGSVSEISRALPAGTELPSAPALFYTSTGDVLPATLRALDRSGVEFESSFIEATKLPAENLQAIHFGAVAQMNLQGFGDPGWRVLMGNEKTVRRTADSLNMEPGTALAHPAAMQSSELKFSLAPNSYSVIRLRLFCAGTDGAKSSNLILARYSSSQLTFGLETAEGQLAGQFQARLSPGGPVSVRLAVLEKHVELYVDDVSARRIPIDPAKRAGAGLIIEPASMWGNPVSAIALSGFSARSVPGRTWLPEVNPESRTHALTVPRFRKDDPPRHALLATNGDVLRGEIEAATASHFGFRSGLENLLVPRERVKAAIWLKKPDENAPPPAPENPALKRLEQKISRTTRYSNAGLTALIGFLQREAVDLKFKLPEKQDTHTFAMQFGNQTIAEALDQICSMFGLRYRLDDAGTIVLEPGRQVAKDMVQKVYWLKAAAFPATAPAQEILASKGIPFPAGAAARWQPNASQLSMTNTAANHAKLAEVLAADFGGSVGSPTHWLLLTSGARFGLAVDKFEQDSISGHHPMYGRCRVPMSDVYVIRTSMPEPTAAMKSLEDWRLVFAPEPVLPETGGQSSPMLGKEAKTFKLPLLGGGDFDLGQEKGKVVVLDFWATWCGPCIKSLPGLIDALSAFPADRVKLIGVNQSEPAEQVKRFLETRSWKLAVVMDAGQSVARQFGVEGIPHTVVIDPNGKVAWVKTGYSPEGAAETAKTVKQLLNGGLGN